jgi:choline dehydrogenase-like flavoprotein
MISDVLWQRPSREEFDVWGTELGNGPTWSFDALEPYYRKAENWTGPPIKTLPGGRADPALGKVFGRNGPMQISYNNYYPGLIEESVAAANTLGARTSSNPVSSSPVRSSLLSPPLHRLNGGGGAYSLFFFWLELSQ